MSLQSFKEKLEKMRGEYIFNFANQDDCDYFFEGYGGEEHMRNVYPVMYNYFMKTREAARQREEMKQDDPSLCMGGIETLYIEKDACESGELEGNEQYARLTLPVNCTFIDPTKNINSNDKASPWTGVTVQANVREKFKSRSLIHRNFSVPGDRYLGNIYSNDSEKESDLQDKCYIIQVEITGLAPNNEIVKVIMQGEQNIGNVEIYNIDNIIVNDPAPKSQSHIDSMQIMMLYGRNSEQPFYKDADYKGGDYYKNVFNDGKVNLLMPIKGKVTFGECVNPEGLLKPSVQAFTRCKAAYDNKQKQLTYRQDLNDDVLFDKLKDKFKPPEIIPGSQTTVSFDISIKDDGSDRSIYDWHADVEGVQDGDPKTIMLFGAFDYLAINQMGIPVEEQIVISSATKEELKNKNREYYVYKYGTNTIYIPPITVYWGCYGKDVKFMMADQTEKKASEIKIGDRLMSTDSEVVTVEDILRGEDMMIYRIQTQDGREIKVSGGHPMMCEGKVVRVSRLKTGDKLNLANGTMAEIESIEVIEYDDLVYNFIFENKDEGAYIIANGFYSGDMRMQNKKSEDVVQQISSQQQEFIDEVMRHLKMLQREEGTTF